VIKPRGQSKIDVGCQNASLYHDYFAQHHTYDAYDAYHPYQMLKAICLIRFYVPSPSKDGKDDVIENIWNCC